MNARANSSPPGLLCTAALRYAQQSKKRNTQEHFWIEFSLHAAAQAQHQVERGLLLDVVVRQRAAIFELLAGEDQALLIWRDALFVLDLRFDVVDGVAGLNVKRDRLARERLDEDLHAAAQAQHQVKRRLLLDVVVRQRAAILELLAGEDQALLIWRDALFVLDLRFDVVD